MIALALISPLRFRLHEQPLPLDVAPQHDVLTREDGRRAWESSSRTDQGVSTLTARARR
jgi:hypothetical protein